MTTYILPPTRFADAAAVSAVGSHEYAVNVHPDYSYGPAGHGGFLFALLWRAIAAHFNTTLRKYAQPDTIALHIEFLRPAATGEARVHVKDVRLGKTSCMVHISLVQGKTERVVGYATNVNRSKSKGMSHVTGYNPIPSPPPIDFDKLLANNDPNWIRYQVSYKSDIMNKALSNYMAAIPRTPPADKAIKQQWVAPALPGQTWKTDMLGLVVDAAIPAIENFYPDSPHSTKATADRCIITARDGPPKEVPQWSAPRFYPTVNMSMDIKKVLPDEGVKWLFVLVRTKDVREGRFDNLVEVWDESGELVALSQQLWMAVEIDVAALKGRRRGPGPSGKL